LQSLTDSEIRLPGLAPTVILSVVRSVFTVNEGSVIVRSTTAFLRALSFEARPRSLVREAAVEGTVSAGRGGEAVDELAHGLAQIERELG